MEFFYRLSSLYWRIVTALYYRPQFGAIGNRTLIRHPLMIRGAKSIYIGSGCGIRDGARIEVMSAKYPNARLEIGNETSIEQGVHIVCGSTIRIGQRVTITPRCVIVDVNHPYEDVTSNAPIGQLLPDQPSPIEIGDECFLGAGCVILPGVKLGKHCVIGANAVVTKSMEAYTVCAGNPAKPIRRYDFSGSLWAPVRK